MKRLMFILMIAVIAAGAAFAQRVGDTVQYAGSTYTVQSINGDTVIGMAM